MRLSEWNISDLDWTAVHWTIGTQQFATFLSLFALGFKATHILHVPQNWWHHWCRPVSRGEAVERGVGCGAPPSRVSLTSSRDGDVPLPARRTPVGSVSLSTAAFSLDHLLFLHAWVVLGWRGKKCGPALASFFPGALKCKVWLLLDRVRSSWRFWHEKQPGLSGLPHRQWSGTKPIILLTRRYNYQSEWGKDRRMRAGCTSTQHIIPTTSGPYPTMDTRVSHWDLDYSVFGVLWIVWKTVVTANIGIQRWSEWLKS